MNSSNPNKIYPIIILAVLMTAACGFWQADKDDNKIEKPNSVLESGVPFSTKEPKTYSTEIIVSTFSGENKTDRKILFARKNGASLIRFNVGQESSTSKLRTETGENFLINHAKKTFSRTKSTARNSDEKLWSDFYTTKLLNEKTNSKFENLGSANGETKYRVVLEGNNNNEAVITVSDEIGLPILQEFYRLNNGKNELTYSIKLENFTKEPDENLFRIPSGYEEITD